MSTVGTLGGTIENGEGANTMLYSMSLVIDLCRIVKNALQNGRLATTRKPSKTIKM